MRALVRAFVRAIVRAHVRAGRGRWGGPMQAWPLGYWAWQATFHIGRRGAAALWLNFGSVARAFAAAACVANAAAAIERIAFWL